MVAQKLMMKTVAAGLTLTTVGNSSVEAMRSNFRRANGKRGSKQSERGTKSSLWDSVSTRLEQQKQVQYSNRNSPKNPVTDQ